MGLLFLWISTIVISKSMDVITSCRIIRDIADEGYKIKPDRFRDISSELTSDSTNYTKIRSIIPFYNVFSSMNIGLEYFRNKGNILDQLYLLDTVERMDREEIELYNKKPSAFRAISIANKKSDKFKQYESLKDETKSKAICVEYNKNNKLRFTLLYHNLNNYGEIRIDEIRINVEEKIINNQEEYDTLLKSELNRIQKLCTHKHIFIGNFIKKIQKCKHKDYMRVGEIIVDKDIKYEEENIKNKGEKFNSSRLDEIRRKKETLINEKNRLISDEEKEKKLERKK